MSTETPVSEIPQYTKVDTRQLIGGEWVDSDARETIVSPATGEEIGTVAQGTPEDVDRAVAAARTAAEDWGARSVFDRLAVLKRLAAVVNERRDELALALALEQGKPFATEAREEVGTVIRYLELAEQAVIGLEGTIMPSQDPAKRVFVERRPRGVVGAIQPWNYPLETVGIQTFNAMACGNTVVSIPAPTTSLSPHIFAECCVEAELPKGVYNNISGAGPVIGDALTGHPGVDVVAFTGSTLTGGLVAQRAAGKVLLLELGGNGPFVVLDDADLDIVIPAAMYSCFYTAGQLCTAAERLLVQDGIHDAFVERLAAAVQDEITLGGPLDPATTMGPLNNEKVAAKVDAHVANAGERGADIVVGGSRAAGFPTDLYWRATVVTGVTDAMDIATEETFGPVAPIQRISSEEDALRMMHASDYGLNSAVFTRDIGRGLRFAQRASTGQVVVNDMSIYNEQHIPFGGAPGKGSGVNRAQGIPAMQTVFTELKTIIVSL